MSRQSLRVIAIAFTVVVVLPVLAWVGWATWAFGTPVPHSILAKSVVHPRGGSLYTVQALTDRLAWTSDALSAPLPAIPAIGWALVAVGFGLVWRRGNALWRVPAVFILLLPVFLHLGRAPNFWWYPVPVAGAAALVGARALQPLWQRVSERVAWAVTALALIGGGVHLVPTAEESKETQHNEDQMRAEVGRWIDTHAPADASVAMEAIGYQGTFAHRRVVDLAGLVSPEILAIARETPDNAERFARMLEAEKPWAVVLRGWEVPRNRHFHGGRLFRDDAARDQFLADYAEAARFSAPFPERMGRRHDLVVYVRTRQ